MPQWGCDGFLAGLRHGDLACRCLSGIPARRRGSSGRSSPRPPCPQVLQGHPRVAKRASIGTLARGPSTEALLGQGHVPKGRESVPLTGLRSGSRPGLARRPRLQTVLRQGRVAKGTSIGTLARGPCPQVLQGHPRMAKHHPTGPSARRPTPQVLQCHLREAKRVFWPSFGTSPQPKGPSAPSRPGALIAPRSLRNLEPVSSRCSDRPFGTVRVSDGWSMNR